MGHDAALGKGKNYPALFRRLTGLSVEAFEQLMEGLTKAYPDFERALLQRRERRRAIGAGGKFKLSLSERVIMTLLFLPLSHYALLGFLFGLHDRGRGSWGFPTITQEVYRCIQQ